MNPEGGVDSFFRLTAAEESGALPDERVECACCRIAGGEVWVGTDRGLVRYLFPDRIITGSALGRRGQRAELMLTRPPSTELSCGMFV